MIYFWIYCIYLLYLLLSLLHVFVLIVVFLIPAAIQISFGVVINLTLEPCAKLKDF